MKKIINSSIASIVCAVILLSILIVPVSAANEVINVTDINAKVTSNTTLYAGEVFLDGQSAVRYLYSDDIALSKTVMKSVKECFSASDTDEFSELVPELDDDITGKGFVACSDDEYAVNAKDGWKEAKNMASDYYPDKTVESFDSCDLYQTDEGFAAACSNGWDAENTHLTDEKGDPFEICGPLGALTVSYTDSVTYTVIDGELIAIKDRIIDYTCESVTVIYTSASVKSSAGGKINTAVMSFSKCGDGMDLIPADSDAAAYIAEKKAAFQTAVSQSVPAGMTVETPGLDDLFTNNMYAVFKKSEFQGLSYKFSNDAIFIGDLDDFDNATVVSGTVTRESHYTVSYIFVSVTTADEEWIPGDINGDASVDNKDVVALFRYLSGVDVKVKVIALDCNGDNDISNKDVTTLFRYLSGGFDVVLSSIPYKK